MPPRYQPRRAVALGVENFYSLTLFVLPIFHVGYYLLFLYAHALMAPTGRAVLHFKLGTLHTRGDLSAALVEGQSSGAFIPQAFCNFSNRS